MLGHASLQMLLVAEVKFFAFAFSETLGGVIVYHAAGLHIGVHYRGSYKCKTTFFHIFTNGVGNGAGGG